MFWRHFPPGSIFSCMCFTTLKSSLLFFGQFHLVTNHHLRSLLAEPVLKHQRLEVRCLWFHAQIGPQKSVRWVVSHRVHAEPWDQYPWRIHGAAIYGNMDPINIHPMYAIYGNIYHQYSPSVSIYTIHGSYGIWIRFLSSESTCETWVCYQDDSSQSIGDKRWQKIAQTPESGQIGIFMKTAKNFCGNLELTITILKE